ncbi:MAG: pilus assembly protein [Chloroflexi bacterium]|nr:pilus assembly protein [Chloroflexota bacterium]
MPFLLFLVLALYEMAQVFTAYIALVNAAREGAVFASLNSELSDPVKVPSDNQLYKDYTDRVKQEILALELNPQYLTVSRPVSATVAPSTRPSITVTLGYQLQTFVGTVAVPFFGRMGLPSTYGLSYSVGMPIRDGP